MQPLPRPPERCSASPLPSWATARPNVVPRYVPFSETLQAIWRHLTGRPKPTTRERWFAERAVERLAEEMEEEAVTQGTIPLGSQRKTTGEGEGHGATTN